ncbi:SDR family oxidoreductase [Pedobacter antarcticus]|uniref:NAD-dependent dehydratase n=2 Tax=Pedobacter antarcticus TaxID=34086 RepID=A0A081PM45_9SPHI|nr:SDR family oxidoreductase [Pedobacter antarcticus]KEQ31768.1 NAD-dependent dehydratase [Pedobacter antarcticus 4BY]SDM64793.1 Nucleoside-diphosphate-sugar epimerase [Pedobacter antarcticus]SFF34607.1 Nucleoside-diphosphate-sugar epimerase [Pedobacter antarcticus]
MDKIALVVGSSGIAGSNLAEKLISRGWETYGLARRPNIENKELKPVAADLMDLDSLRKALAEVRPTHVYITTWMRNETEAENIRVNGLMVRNLLSVLSEGKSVEHVALVTGLKHYLGPFEAYAKEGFLPETPLREEHPRLDLENFYYAQEDEVYAAAERDGFTWSIHRPHTVIGMAVGNAMNMGTTLAVYASICKETGRKFIWPGSSAQWNGISDVTDAGVLAEHLIWASTTDVARNEAFNIVNGDVFRWSRLWKRLAGYFDVAPVGFDGQIHPLELTMANDGEIWKQIAEKYKLKENSLSRLATAWHTDLDLGRPIEVMTDMSKSRKMGFTVFQDTEEAFYNLFEKLKRENLIP